MFQCGFRGIFDIAKLLPRYWGIEGVWASMTGSDILAAILAIVTVIISIRRENIRMGATTASPSITE